MVWGCRAVYSKAFRFYVFESNDSVSISSIIESRDAIFNENRFSSVPRPSLRIPNRTEYIGGSVVPKEATKEDDLKTFDEAMKSQDVAFWKEVINDEMYSIMGNNTWVLVDLPPEIDYFDTYALVARIYTIRLLIAMALIHNLIIHHMDVKSAFLNGDLDKEFYMNQPRGFIMTGNENKLNGYNSSSSCYETHGFNHGSSLLVLRDGDTPSVSKRLTMVHLDARLHDFYLTKRESNFLTGCHIDESDKRVIICLYVNDMLIFGTDEVHVDLIKEFLSSKFAMKDMREADVILVSTPMDTSEKLMPNNGQAVSQLEYSRISNTEDNSSTSGWVFLFGGGAISWASKKQTCITGSTMESKFVALASAGKEAECAATLAKAYSQMYSGKSRHLGVRHNMIRELITNVVISIEFVRSQQNLADHLTKGLARDLVIK
ncbi:zinc finger, CCHC-type containing protein [Tanacetum coccineum]